MTEDIKKLEILVDDLNRIFEDTTGEQGETWRPFSLRAEGQWQNIGFFDYPIWMSQDDEREYLPDETRVAVEHFVRQRAASLLRQWAKVAPRLSDL